MPVNILRKEEQLKCMPVLRRNAYVEISVEDNGRGISEEDVAHDHW